MTAQMMSLKAIESAELMKYREISSLSFLKITKQNHERCIFSSYYFL